MTLRDRISGFFRGFTKRSVTFPPEWQEYVLGYSVDQGYNPTKALQCSALIACIRILSNAIASLPLNVFQIVPEGMLPAPQHEVDRLISLQPGKLLTSSEWRRDMVTRMLLFGRNFDQILVNGKDEVIGLNPIHPCFVEIKDPAPDKRTFEVRSESGEKRTLQADEVLYIPFLFEGQSLYEHARRSVGLALNAEEFASKFFRAGGVQQLKLETDQQIAPDKKREIVEAMHRAFMEGKTPFLDSGAKLGALNVKFEEVQLKDTRTHQLRDIARIMGVQPHLIGDLERSTNNNIEHQGIEFVQFTAIPLAVAIEQRLDISLFGKREALRYCARFDLSKLKQADQESTADAVGKLVTNGVMMPNEARRRIGLNDHPDGNKLLIQGAMIPINKAGQEQQANGATGSN